MAEKLNLSFDTEAFIRMVKSRPFLYDKKRKEFKDMALKQAQWVGIGTAFQISAEDCVKKWKNLRDRYIKIKKTVNKSKRCGDVVKINWKYYEIMDSILKVGCRSEQTNSCKSEPDTLVSPQSGITDPESAEDICNGDEVDVSPSSSLEVEISTPECVQNSTPPPLSAQQFNLTQQSSERKTKRNSEEPTFEVIRQTLNSFNKFLQNTNTAKDEVYYFTNSVACRLRKLERKKMLKTMNQIENVLFEQEMSE